MAKVRFVLIFYLLLFTSLAFAQEPTQPVRLELPFNRTENSVEVLALPDSSLLVYHKTSNAWNTKADFYFTKYNQKLEQVWTTSVDIPPSYDFVRHYTEMPYTYLIFTGDIPEEYIFTRTNSINGRTDVKKYKLDDIEAIHEFNVLQGNYFLIGHNRFSQKPLLLHLKPSEEKPKHLPSVYGEESTFSDMLADQENRRLDVVLSESNGRVSRLQVKSFNADGELLGNHFILQQNDKSLLNAEITPGDSAQKMLLGTYGTRDLRYTSGFFTKPVSAVYNTGDFYSIMQLKNFLKYMKPRREERTRAREAARLRAGKEPLYRFRILLHDLITTPTGYILAGEAYYPQYRNNSVSLPLERRQAFMQNTEGYKRTHAVAMGFDKKGNLLWDNTFPLKDVASMELVHTVEVARAPDGRVIMAYPDQEEIIYHIMQEDKFDDKEHKLKIMTYNENEKAQATEDPGIIKWYDNHFVAFGFQRIKPSGAEYRTVFYLNKISF
ncbi:hypothetical protein ABID22_001396 [Pontibacter aydingkolensis]|uniref:Uncharacterized protein n=1 Tax=Pontibacter aydingkolensis TaxID=1911536 RepID=A0ABS7CNY6_9BACT|nr:hypothetical protein [Pontibacter aydingkolensis]MBW7465560.1 hypothetical protein [Pontibacter aydingkolensis]